MSIEEAIRSLDKAIALTKDLINIKPTKLIIPPNLTPEEVQTLIKLAKKVQDGRT